jgi:hypothetical protein
VVRAGGIRSGRPRRRADTRPRARAGRLRQGQARGALAVLDARRDGRLHVAGAVAVGAGGHGTDGEGGTSARSRRT